MIRKLLLSITLVVASHAQAESVSRPTSLPYTETFARCSQTTKTTGLKTQMRLIWESFEMKTAREGFAQTLQVVTVNPAAIAEAIQTRGLTPRVSMLINSPDFHLALQDCYGNDTGLQRAYIAGLIASDMSGKVVGAAVVAATGWVTARIFTAVTAAYPILRYTLVAASGLSASYQAIRALRDVMRNATPAERLAIQKMINTPLAEADRLVNDTQTLLKMEIEKLKKDAKSTPEADRPAVIARMNMLMNHLDKLQSFEINPSRIQG